MAKKVNKTVVERSNKKTSIGRKNIKTSSMNKTKRKSFKVYRGQG